jgi:uncharacterized protein
MTKGLFKKAALLLVVMITALPAYAETGSSALMRDKEPVGAAPSVEGTPPRIPARPLAAPNNAPLSIAPAMTAAPQRENSILVEKVNAGTVTIIAHGLDNLYSQMIADMATVLDRNDDVRVMPIVGRSSLDNVRDILFLRGVDLGIVQMDAREALKLEGVASAALEPLRYLATLYSEDVHLLAQKDIANLGQLDRQKVNIDRRGSTSDVTGRVLFSKMNIRPEFTHFDLQTAYEKLKIGEIKAILLVEARPSPFISKVQSDQGLRLLPLASSGVLAKTYQPSRFTSADYPHLIEASQSVETIAVDSLLAAYGWPENSERYKKVEAFTNVFFNKFSAFQQAGRHPKWHHVNLKANSAGWQKFKAAQNWLDRNSRLARPLEVQGLSVIAAQLARKPPLQGSVAIAPARLEPAKPDLVRSGTGSVQTRPDQKLFEQFEAWQRARQENQTGSP